jgi:GT2 family glycosyltransferase
MDSGQVPDRPAASVSAVICSRGRPEMLREAVAGVLELSSLPDELIVVDQSDVPEPHLATTCDTPVPVRYLWRPDHGLSRARNTGVRAARGDVIAFLDDDVRPDHGWCDEVRRLGDSVNAPVATGLVRAGAAEVDRAWVPSTTEHRRSPQIFRGLLRHDVLAGGNTACRKEVFDRVGLFDERLGVGTDLPGAEDNDFGYRVLRAGLSIEYRPDMSVVHRAWRRQEAVVPVKFGYGRGQGAFYTKHALAGDPRMIRRFAGDAWGHVRRALGRTVTRHHHDAAADIAYVAGLLAGALTWLRRL